MIPKIIHYVWFGNKPLPKLAKKCIKSWKKYCPDFLIMKWDENNFDINYNFYTKEAFETKKWAFLSDVARLYALVTYGGIYMDTDVELIQSINPFLSHQAFSGFESTGYVPTGIMGCEKENPLFKRLLKDYDNKHFVGANNVLDLTTNCIAITNVCKEKGLILNDTFQVVEGFALYPHDYFCPKGTDMQIHKTQNTVAIHHFAGSWLPNQKASFFTRFKNLCKKILFKFREIKK